DMGIVEEKLAYLNVFVNKHRNENVLDISPAGIHKWQALQTLGVEKGDYIAFGNDANDMTMFQNAAHAVMIGHHEELMQYATEFIPFNESVEQAIIENITKQTKYHFKNSLNNKTDRLFDKYDRKSLLLL